MYEIYESRLVTQGGNVVEEELAQSRHHASVYCDIGHVDVRLAPHDANVLWMKVIERDADGDVPLYVNDLTAALSDLYRLRGDGPDEETSTMRERAATVVERAARHIEGDGTDPLLTTLASDLRATMLQLIELSHPA